MSADKCTPSAPPVRKCVEHSTRSETYGNITVEVTMTDATIRGVTIHVAGSRRSPDYLKLTEEEARCALDVLKHVLPEAVDG